MSNQRPPFETFKKPTCRGCYALGSACGTCEKCAWERRDAGFTLEYVPPPDPAVVERSYYAGWSDLRAIVGQMLRAAGQFGLANQLYEIPKPPNGDKG